MDGRMLLAGVDWTTLPLPRLLNVLAALMQQDASSPAEVMAARTRFRDLLDGVPVETGSFVPDAEVPVSAVDARGVPVGLREMPLGEVG